MTKKNIILIILATIIFITGFYFLCSCENKNHDKIKEFTITYNEDIESIDIICNTDNENLVIHSFYDDMYWYPIADTIKNLNRAFIGKDIKKIKYIKIKFDNNGNIYF